MEIVAGVAAVSSCRRYSLDHYRYATGRAHLTGRLDAGTPPHWADSTGGAGLGLLKSQVLQRTAAIKEHFAPKIDRGDPHSTSVTDYSSDYRARGYSSESGARDGVIQR